VAARVRLALGRPIPLFGATLWLLVWVFGPIALPELPFSLRRALILPLALAALWLSCIVLEHSLPESSVSERAA
jgi:hypothetical protein